MRWALDCEALRSDSREPKYKKKDGERQISWRKLSVITKKCLFIRTNVLYDAPLCYLVKVDFPRERAAPRSREPLVAARTGEGLAEQVVLQGFERQALGREPQRGVRQRRRPDALRQMYAINGAVAGKQRRPLQHARSSPRLPGHS